MDGATVRNIYTGHSGYMGTMAARLVECGFTGEVDSVSAIYGKILSDTFDPDRVVRPMRAPSAIAVRLSIRRAAVEIKKRQLFDLA